MNKYAENEIDFVAIEHDIRNLEAPKMDAREVVQRLHGVIAGMVNKGVRHDDICKVLEKHGVKMAASTMLKYLREGKPKTRLNYRAASDAIQSLENNEDGGTQRSEPQQPAPRT